MSTARRLGLAVVRTCSAGVVLGFLLVGTFALLNRLDVSSEEQFPWAVIYALLILYPAIVGFAVGRRDGRIRAGAWAGAVTAAIGWGIALLSLLGVGSVIGIMREIFGMAVFGVIGTVCGAIGALAGTRLRARRN
jgi:hypothetical protein